MLGHDLVDEDLRVVLRDDELRAESGLETLGKRELARVRAGALGSVLVPVGAGLPLLCFALLALGDVLLLVGLPFGVVVGMTHVHPVNHAVLRLVMGAPHHPVPLLGVGDELPGLRDLPGGGLPRSSLVRLLLLVPAAGVVRSALAAVRAAAEELLVRRLEPLDVRGERDDLLAGGDPADPLALLREVHESRPEVGDHLRVRQLPPAPILLGQPDVEEELVVREGLHLLEDERPVHVGVVGGFPLRLDALTEVFHLREQVGEVIVEVGQPDRTEACLERRRVNLRGRDHRSIHQGPKAQPAPRLDLLVLLENQGELVLLETERLEVLADQVLEELVEDGALAPEAELLLDYEALVSLRCGVDADRDPLAGGGELEEGSRAAKNPVGVFLRNLDDIIQTHILIIKNVPVVSQVIAWKVLSREFARTRGNLSIARCRQLEKNEVVPFRPSADSVKIDGAMLRVDCGEFPPRGRLRGFTPKRKALPRRRVNIKTLKRSQIRSSLFRGR